MKKQSGFTLIELMVVVAIIGILSAIVIPSYSRYVQRSKLADATSGLSAMRVSMEQWYQDHRTYQNANGTACGVAVPASQYFDFTCTAGTADTYDLTATGKATGGVSGFVFTLNQLNVKGSTITAQGWTAVSGAACWVTKQDGSC